MIQIASRSGIRANATQMASSGIIARFPPPGSVVTARLFVRLSATLVLSFGGVAQAQSWPQRINDSGQASCYAGAGDSSIVATPCSSTSWPGQDAAYGRDAAGGSLPKLGAGAAGFDFSKLSSVGEEVPPTAPPGLGPGRWACTRDNATGLVWRVAVASAVSWASARVQAYAHSANGGLCGFVDWRLPTSAELLGVVHFGRSAPAVDVDYFPNVQAAFYWTADSDLAAERAQVVNFSGGFAHRIDARAPAGAMLVAGGASFAGFADGDSGTLTDPRTGLMWDRCALGQNSVDGCAGDADFHTWQGALQAARSKNAQAWRGFSDWRVPNVKELATLLALERQWPAIDTAAFPDAPATAFWSSTSNFNVLRGAWAVFFGEGNVFAKDKMTRAAVRLVRNAVAAPAGGVRDALFADSFDLAQAPPQLPADMLPTVAILTDGGAPIQHGVYIPGSMTIPATAESPAYSGTLQIKGRGNSTWGMPKKPYRIKLDAKAELLGMAKDKNWALLANYADKTLLHNRVALALGQRLGMGWSPDSRMVKVTVNGQYQGVYQLIETIRVGSNRVDIAEMEPADIALPEVSGGYLFEIDQRRDCAANVLFSTSRNVPFCIDTPDDDEIVWEQYDYLRNYVQNTEDAIWAPDFSDPATGYRAWLEPSSFIDWYLVNEITANVDARDYSSIWNFKDRDGLLERGPLWDFDLGFGNANYCACADPQGFWVHGGIWYARLFQDPTFAAQTRARWDDLKTDVFDALPALMDSEAAWIHGAVEANFIRWPIPATYVWPNVVVTGSWEGDVAYGKDWLRQRIAWLDEHL